MWPYLFGAGWIWGALVAAGAVAGAVAIAVAARSIGAARQDAGANALQSIWHRYEEGDLTRWEFERLVSSAHATVGLLGETG